MPTRPTFESDAYSVTFGEPFDPRRALPGGMHGAGTLTTPVANFPALPFMPMAAVLEGEIATARAAQATTRANTARSRAQSILEEINAMPAFDLKPLATQLPADRSAFGR